MHATERVRQKERGRGDGGGGRERWGEEERKGDVKKNGRYVFHYEKVMWKK